jgi:hypothetical protein
MKVKDDRSLLSVIIGLSRWLGRGHPLRRRFLTFGALGSVPEILLSFLLLLPLLLLFFSLIVLFLLGTVLVHFEELSELIGVILDLQLDGRHDLPHIL